ncbi:MAG TPA: penicillin acylase family protein [Fimbriimonadaceae bacterium]|nr:penicillin acylase family protein [Fimbriimonadaceae bacterium]HRJ33019.1 penicillin acylase family protein [Fimbriimonadaceae bacterium]
MSAAWLSILLLLEPSGSVTRDEYGVPLVAASSRVDAWYWAGRAVAQDRPWQLEISRRSARGKLAEALGEAGVSSDREVLRTGYTDAELQKQFDSMSAPTRQEWNAYARGITDEFANLEAAGRLPEAFRVNSVRPEPWSVLDSAAIAVRMARLFGTGGAGELRNTLLYRYLQGQKIQDQLLDAFEDLAWQLDPNTIPTVPPEDDPIRRPPVLFQFTQADTKRQLAALPPSNVLELMPAIRLAEHRQERWVAEQNNVLYKSGSYAIVVAPKRSRSGRPLLLSGPQMGHRTPSIAYEMAIQAPSLQVTGLLVPGVPTILIGATPHSAWGLTSGIADLADVVFNPVQADGTILVDGRAQPIERVERTLKVRGGAPQSVIRQRTSFGVVVLESAAAKVVYSLKTSLWMRELAGFDQFRTAGSLRSVEDFRRVAARVPVTFNLFFALNSGEIGYFYCGDVPIRAPGIDPRFPTLGSRNSAWRGFVPKSQMPHVVNPSGGLLFNWNNQPADWWPNLDTPAWGNGFRNQLLGEQIPEGLLSRRDLENAIEQIARRDSETCGLLQPWIDRALQNRDPDWSPVEVAAAKLLVGYDGRREAGQSAPLLMASLLETLREELFAPRLGTFLTPANLAMVTQAAVVLRALDEDTLVDFLSGRSAEEVVRAAFRKAVTRVANRAGQDVSKWKFVPNSISVPGEPPIPYSDRGTFIQIVELGPKSTVRTVLSPGIAEEGPHSRDQVPLARAWRTKVRQPGW